MSTPTLPPPVNVVTNDSEERSMAALAHGSILLNFFIPGLGIVAAAAVWLTQRERSAYAAHQALQAAVFQLLLAIVPIVLSIGGLIMGAVVFVASMPAGGPGPGEGAAVVLIIFAILAALFILFLLFLGLLYALVGAYESYQGRDFRYWLVGNLVKRT